MKKILTYNLCSGASKSDQFYSDISSFTNAWFSKVPPSHQKLAEQINAWRLDQGGIPRSLNSSLLDLLALGVIFNEHADQIMNFPNWASSGLRRLVEFQTHHPAMEWWLKLLRGFVLQLANSGLGRRKLELSKLDAVISWLTVLGESTQAERFLEIRDFARSRGMEGYLLDQCVMLSNDFTTSSLLVLGKYTQEVEIFLASNTKKKKWRYDARLISSTRAEYHLGMMGTEILNREFRSKFLSTGKKVVIVPPCMRACSEIDCKAVLTALGAHCMSCTPGCRINQVTCLGRKYGFEVYIIPEEIRVFKNERKEADRVGVVGVSCVLTNWTGGWDAERIGLPVQGVLLDYVGCRYHWDKQGFPTDLNFHKLLEILDSRMRNINHIKTVL